MAGHNETVFKWHPVFRSNGVDPNAARAMMERVRGERSRLDPCDLVLASEPASSPTHDLFQWDDGKAADAYRVSQAEEAIRSVTVEAAGKLEPVYRSVEVIVPQGDRSVVETRYAAISIKPSKPVRRRVIQPVVIGADRKRALKSLRLFVKKYDDMPDTHDLVEGVEDLLEEVGEADRDTDAA